MAIGEHIVSAYNGPSDVKSFDLLDHELSTTSSSESNNSENGLEIYYQQIRDFREGTNTTISRNKVFNEVKLKFPNDWLLSVELYELAVRNGDTNFALEIKTHLKAIKQKHSKLEQLIDDGLALVDTPA